MMMPNRLYSAQSGYRFGFNGQESSSELHKNSYSAEYWEYDSRTAKRWNKDPIIKVSEAPYLAFGNNPIMLSDPNGADTINITKKTTFDIRQHTPAVYSKGGLEAYPSRQLNPGNSGLTITGSINIIEAKGLDVFIYNDVHAFIDADGNETITSSKSTTLDIRGTQAMGYRNSGRNLNGFRNDRYALASIAPGWLLKYYAAKNQHIDFPTWIGTSDARALQSEIPFVKGLNDITNATYLISGGYGIFKASLSRSIAQAFPSGFVTSQLEGFYLRSASSMSNGIYKKTIQTLAYMGDDGAGSMLKVVRSIEAEARAAGAKTLEIHGVEIVNSKILSTSKVAAEKFGFTFEQVSANSLKLTKQLN